MNAEKKMLRQRRKKQQIIEAAADLFVRKGIEGTTLADVAREVGISKGTLYYYFPSKGELVFEITDLHMQRITQELVDIARNYQSGGPLSELIMIVFEALLEARERSFLHLYLLREAAQGNEALKRRFQAKYQEWKDLLIANLREIVPGIKQPQVVAEIIVACIDGLLIQQRLDITGQPVAELVQLMASLAAPG